MNSLQIAYSLMRVPRLFITLLLFPLLIGVALALVQLIFMGLLALSVSTPQLREDPSEVKNVGANTLRSLLYGDEQALEQLQICRHSEKQNESYYDTCNVGELDVVVKADHLDPELLERYQYLFQGAAPRLHLCERCRGNIEIEPGASPRTTVRDIWSLGVMAIALAHNQHVFDAYIENSSRFFSNISALGSIRFHALGLREAVRVDSVQLMIVVICNIAMLIVITLWLGLKAHRKVLDYFIESNALLPLVSACGKRQFYGAVWILTITRIALFLLALVPALSAVMISLNRRGELAPLLGGNVLSFLLWIVVLSISLSLLMIIGSVADLKRRYQLFSIVYRYLPLFIGFLGAVVWCFTLLIASPTARWIQHTISVLPIAGVTPVLLSPIMPMHVELLMLHGLLSLLLLLFFIRVNATWFAAHLDQI